MSDSDSYARGIVPAAYPQLLSGKYCVMASSALLWFDFVLTFPTEVRRIWGHGFTSATLVYLFTRYPAIVDRVLVILEIFIRSSSDQTCGRISRVDGVMVTLKYFGFSAFTILGVYGVWGPDWRPLVVVVPLTLVQPVLYIVI
ncbi:hypothetical protein V8D89_008478 [Ganoderma adspersum]